MVLLKRDGNLVNPTGAATDYMPTALAKTMLATIKQHVLNVQLTNLTKVNTPPRTTSFRGQWTK